MEDKKNIVFQENDFELVQSETKIKDKKLETKPTTFFKDAFRRFCKNKASVSAAFIIGILILLAIFVPIFTPYDIGVKHVSTPEKFLEPKLFEVNKYHFWDGTKKYTNVVYDTENETPAGYKKSAVYDCVVHEMTYVNQANAFGHNGYVMFETDNLDVVGRPIYYLESRQFDFRSTGNYSVKIAMYNEEGVLGNVLGEYRIILKSDDGEIVLKDWSKEYPESLEYDLSQIIADNGLTVYKSTLRFELKSSSESLQYILIKSVEFSCDENMPNYEDLCGGEGTYKDDNSDAELPLPYASFSDATQMVLEKDKLTNDDLRGQGYWTCNGRKGIYKSEIYYCDFYFDTYENVYGIEIIKYSESDLKKLALNGYLTYEYDKTTDTLTYEILDPVNCPFEEIIDHDVIGRSKKLNNVIVETHKWRKYGYTSQPKYILGTELTGRDMFAYAFAGLRTSLILGLCTAAFCFTFGLLWGAISGYFGGNVDIAMERFCEILSGVPWIVMMTLFILHLGRSFITFFFALCLTGWMGTAARTRTQFYRFKGREYVLASRTLGASDLRLIFKHILPNSMGTIITGAVLMIPSTIFSEATIAYLNLGLQDKQSFGVMMATNQPFLENHAYVVVFPAIVMALLMISFNLFGNGLRDAFNPSLKGSD